MYSYVGEKNEDNVGTFRAAHFLERREKFFFAHIGNASKVCQSQTTLSYTYIGLWIITYA